MSINKDKFNFIKIDNEIKENEYTSNKLNLPEQEKIKYITRFTIEKLIKKALTHYYYYSIRNSSDNILFIVGGKALLNYIGIEKKTQINNIIKSYDYDVHLTKNNISKLTNKEISITEYNIVKYIINLMNRTTDSYIDIIYFMLESALNSIGYKGYTDDVDFSDNKTSYFFPGEVTNKYNVYVRTIYMKIMNIKTSKIHYIGVLDLISEFNFFKHKTDISSLVTINKITYQNIKDLYMTLYYLYSNNIKPDSNGIKFYYLSKLIDEGHINIAEDDYYNLCLFINNHEELDNIKKVLDEIKFKKNLESFNINDFPTCNSKIHKLQYRYYLSKNNILYNKYYLNRNNNFSSPNKILQIYTNMINSDDLYIKYMTDKYPHELKIKLNNKNIIYEYSINSSMFTVNLIKNWYTGDNTFLENKLKIRSSETHDYDITIRQYRDLLFEMLTSIDTYNNNYKKSILKENKLTVYSGLNYFNLKNGVYPEDFYIGKVFTNNSFRSSTYNIEIALSFKNNEKIDSNPCCLLKINIDSFQKSYLAIKKHTKYPNEEEILLCMGGIFVVKDIKYMYYSIKQVLVIEVDYYDPPKNFLKNLDELQDKMDKYKNKYNNNNKIDFSISKNTKSLTNIYKKPLIINPNLIQKDIITPKLNINISNNQKNLIHSGGDNSEFECLKNIMDKYLSTPVDLTIFKNIIKNNDIDVDFDEFIMAFILNIHNNNPFLNNFKTPINIIEDYNKYITSKEKKESLHKLKEEMYKLPIKKENTLRGSGKNNFYEKYTKYKKKYEFLKKKLNK